MYTQDLLSDAEGFLIDARNGDIEAAREALDVVNYYQTLRQNGEGEEPWPGADDYAGDMESEAFAILHPEVKAMRKPVTCGSLLCKLLGFHVGPNEGRGH